MYSPRISGTFGRGGRGSDVLLAFTLYGSWHSSRRCVFVADIRSTEDACLRRKSGEYVSVCSIYEYVVYSSMYHSVVYMSMYYYAVYRVCTTL